MRRRALLALAMPLPLAASWQAHADEALWGLLKAGGQVAHQYDCGAWNTDHWPFLKR